MFPLSPRAATEAADVCRAGHPLAKGAGGLAEQTKTSSGCVDRWVPTVGRYPAELGHVRTHAEQCVVVSAARPAEKGNPRNARQGPACGSPGQPLELWAVVGIAWPVVALQRSRWAPDVVPSDPSVRGTELR